MKHPLGLVGSPHALARSVSRRALASNHHVVTAREQRSPDPRHRPSSPLLVGARHGPARRCFDPHARRRSPTSGTARHRGMSEAKPPSPLPSPHCGICRILRLHPCAQVYIRYLRRQCPIRLSARPPGALLPTARRGAGRDRPRQLRAQPLGGQIIPAREIYPFQTRGFWRRAFLDSACSPTARRLLSANDAGLCSGAQRRLRRPLPHRPRASPSRSSALPSSSSRSSAPWPSFPPRPLLPLHMILPFLRCSSPSFLHRRPTSGRVRLGALIPLPSDRAALRRAPHPRIRSLCRS